MSFQALAAECAGLLRIRQYIQQTWTKLERSNADLLKSAVDTKVGQEGRVVLYVARNVSLDKIRLELQRLLKPSVFQRMRLEQLPENPASIKEQGLLPSSPLRGPRRAVQRDVRLG